MHRDPEEGLADRVKRARLIAIPFAVLGPIMTVAGVVQMARGHVGVPRGPAFPLPFALVFVGFALVAMFQYWRRGGLFRLAAQQGGWMRVAAVAASLGAVSFGVFIALGSGCVQQEGDAGRARDAADLGCRVDQAAAGGDVGDADEFGALVDQVGQSRGVELSGLVVGDDDDLRAGAFGDLEVGEHVAAVLVAAGQDAVARLEGHRVEGRVPGVGGVVEERDLIGSSADQPGDVRVGGVDALAFPVGGLVAADGGLEFEVRGHGLESPAGHQAGSGVVEMYPAGGRARGLPAERVDVHVASDSCLSE